jgi:hypothetical protein
MLFEELSLSKVFKKTEQGYVNPTPIQENLFLISWE